MKPIYTKFDEFSKTGDADAAGKLYHDQAVVVEKGEKATFGREEIVKMLKEFFEKVGPHKFVTSNESYQGTDDYLIAQCDVEVHPEKGGDILKGKTLHIWKKQDGNWLLYHEEYEKLIINSENCESPKAINNHQKEKINQRPKAIHYSGQEVKDVLTARYDAMEKHCQTGDIEKVAEFYHSDGVMIERGVSVAYGRAQAPTDSLALPTPEEPPIQLLKEVVDLMEINQPCPFEKSNEKYEGCEDFLILTCDSTLSSVKRGTETAKVIQIWKKDQGKWTIYHEEYEVKK
ncbi:unnamed protein product [Haemonchus placei]|uniref:DUF4440 domain-containing protein n=1 Tax=Haemonchus placei TaxID=6290 RepID=A0A3P7X3A4_HAEPC|nr:unnamed protein product [Haemonchus placei]